MDTKYPVHKPPQTYQRGSLEGTGDWLFGRKVYRTWKSSSASMLLLQRSHVSSCAIFIGMALSSCLTRLAGAGETYHTSHRQLSILSPRARFRGELAYFCFSRVEENRREPQSILTILIQQGGVVAEWYWMGRTSELLWIRVPHPAAVRAVIQLSCCVESDWVGLAWLAGLPQAN